MKSARALLLAIIFFVAAITASAHPVSDIRIIFDPDPAGPVTLTDIASVGTPVTPTWQSCSDLGVPSTLSAETACIALANLTGQDVTSLDIQFTVPSTGPLIGQIVDCENADNFLTSNNCPEGNLTAGELVDFTMYGGSPVPNDTDVFFGANADGLTDPSQFPPVTITDTTPEPGTLLLFSTGCFLLGLGWRRLRWNRA
ncbi:MAG: PEP-CTERM sorting domain-containing protein [Terriglobia bacterium]